MIQLRSYQLDAVRAVDKAFFQGESAVCLQIPTGGGKTIVAAEIVRRLSSRRVLYVVPSREIFAQTEAKLRAVGITPTLLDAGAKPGMRGVRCLLAMSQTLAKRLRYGFFRSWSPDLIIIDEAHRLLDQHAAVLREFSCRTIALTATPVRLDGRSLGAMWPTLIPGPQVLDLVEGRSLVPTRTLSIPLADLRKVRRKRGDFDAASLGAAFEESRAADLSALLWKQYGEGRKTVAFTPSRAVSATLCDALNTLGVPAEHVDATTKTEDRENALARLVSGEIQVLVNCGLFIEGLDIPSIDCVLVCTSTLSLTKWLQMCGRGMRPFPGKRDLLVIDHGLCAARLGLPDADRDWFWGGRPIKG